VGASAPVKYHYSYCFFTYSMKRGGPLGHPRIFINVDKPQICWCTYCGLPFAHEKHRALLEATPEHELSYPLGPKGDAAEVNETQKVTDEPLAQR